MPALPRISIVTPSFNQADYLGETIESILSQDYPNLEYVIVDGGSTDGSVDIIKRYKRHLAYWVSEKDSGQSEAINKGFARCNGDLFNWINSDDMLFPGALRQIAEIFFRHPGADIIVGCNARSDKEGRITRVSAPPSRQSMSPSCFLFWIGQQSTFIAAPVFKRVGGVREDLHCIMDYDLYYRIFSGGGRYVRTKSLIGLIREHPEAKGVAKQSSWDPERTRILAEYGVSPFSVNAARGKARLGRLLDGSYLRSWLTLRKWKGRRIGGSVGLMDTCTVLGTRGAMHGGTE